MLQVLPEYLQNRFDEWVESVLIAFFSTLEDLDSASFVENLEKAVLYCFSVPDSDDYWSEILSVMRKTVLENAGSDFGISRAELLWQQARVLIGEVVQKHEVSSRLRVEKRSVALREISEMLMSSPSLADVLDVLVLELPRLGV